jgi:ribosome biogenesis GTPase
METEGLVVGVKGVIYDVEDINTEKKYLCMLRGKLRLREREGKSPVVIGDRVIFKKISRDRGVIHSLFPRKNKICRLKGKKEAYIIAANVDKIFIFNAIKLPDIDTVFIDRLLVIAERENIEPVIIINKIDLVNSEEEYKHFGKIYENIGYKVIYTSVIKQEGLEELKKSIGEGINVLVGFSGVGKSSLINAIIPEINLKTQEINYKTGFGKHTTRNALMFKIDKNKYIADTPGIRKFLFLDVEPEELSLFFRDFHKFREKCKFNTCLHIYEEKCGVKEALANGKIHPYRYRSYKLLINECKKRVETYWD